MADEDWAAEVDEQEREISGQVSCVLHADKLHLWDTCGKNRIGLLRSPASKHVLSRFMIVLRTVIWTKVGKCVKC